MSAFLEHTLGREVGQDKFQGHRNVGTVKDKSGRRTSQPRAGTQVFEQ